MSHSGRRSGKTELAKRKLIKKALTFTGAPDGRFIFSAPVNSQARAIFWEDAKAMIPDWGLVDKRSKAISESRMEIRLVNGSKIQVIGMDKAERIEGSPVDGIVLDEYGNMKKTVWASNVRPALSTIGRPGWAWLIGVPEGRNHYYELADDVKNGRKKGWACFNWSTKEVNPEEYESAKGDMDALVFSQEYDGEFVSFEGLAYYGYNETRNQVPKDYKIQYDPNQELTLCFDFNRNPGVALVVQEQHPPPWMMVRNLGVDRGKITTILGEVFIEKNSNTIIVCDKIIEKWGHHKGGVNLHGDASGGNKLPSSIGGSDWDIVLAKLETAFEDKVWEMFPRRNPGVRARINSVNTRFYTADGYIGVMLDKELTPKFVRDLEGVCVTPEGDLDKGSDKILTHISDAYGYYTAEEHPCGGGGAMSSNNF